MKNGLKNYYSNTNSDSACRFEKGQDIFSLERDCRTIIQIRMATAVVFSNREGNLQFGNQLEDYYSNTNSDSGCFFSKRGKTSEDRKEIEGLLYKYE